MDLYLLPSQAFKSHNAQIKGRKETTCAYYKNLLNMVQRLFTVVSEHSVQEMFHGLYYVDCTTSHLLENLDWTAAIRSIWWNSMRPWIAPHPSVYLDWLPHLQYSSLGLTVLDMLKGTAPFPVRMTWWSRHRSVFHQLLQYCQGKLFVNEAKR